MRRITNDGNAALVADDRRASTDSNAAMPLELRARLPATGQKRSLHRVPVAILKNSIDTVEKSYERPITSRQKNPTAGI